LKGDKMMGIVSSKKYRNTSAYRNLELQKMHKYYDEVLQPKVDAAFADIMVKNDLVDTKPVETVFEFNWMMDKGENDGR
jgi:hypothetical protein